VVGIAFLTSSPHVDRGAAKAALPAPKPAQELSSGDSLATPIPPPVAEVKPPKPEPPSKEVLASRATSKPAVPAETRLAQDLLDQWTAYTEWLLDLPFTEVQRHQFQQLFTSDWNKLSLAAKDSFCKQAAQELPGRLSDLSNYESDMLRAQRLPRFLVSLQNTEAAFATWLLELYRSAYRPGGTHNQVLVAGNPQLTHNMVVQYGDFIEWALGLRFSGGLTDEQRDVLAEAVVTAWPSMDRSAQEGFVEVLNNWHVITQSTPAERARAYEKLHQEFLSQLRSTGDAEPSQWLLAIYENEQHLARIERSK
jgi:hypothetical protein